MGQIKNIKLHIVTDIKIKRSILHVETYESKITKILKLIK